MKHLTRFHSVSHTALNAHVIHYELRTSHTRIVEHVNDKPPVAQLVKNFPTSHGGFMSKSVSQERGNGPYPQTDKSLSQHAAVHWYFG